MAEGRHLSSETLADMITTVVESRFGSWFEFRNYRWGVKVKGGEFVPHVFSHNVADSKGYAEVEVRHRDGDTGEVLGDWVKVTPTDLRKGAEKFANHMGKQAWTFEDDYDIIDADGAFQFLLFDELTYG